MSNDPFADQERWEELQVARLLFGLSADELEEHDELARRMPAEESDLFGSVVASIDVAWSDPQPLPAHLRRAIQLQAEKELLARCPTPASAFPVSGKPAVSRSDYLPWLVAAACLVILVFTWISNRPVQSTTPSVAQLRAELIESAKDLVQANWSDGTTPIQGATGDVVWSSARQRGFMRFRGLPLNRPTTEQYQLWIFDKNQSDKTPIDGGVFDILAPGEVIVPIDAKLQVQQVFMFAVTIEKPGGVVVSTRERLPLLAKVE